MKFIISYVYFFLAGAVFDLFWMKPLFSHEWWGYIVAVAIGIFGMTIYNALESKE